MEAFPTIPLNDANDVDNDIYPNPLWKTELAVPVDDDIADTEALYTDEKVTGKFTDLFPTPDDDLDHWRHV